MRRIVTPATPTARIVDPDHGDFLPPEGRGVAFSPYWHAHEQQRNVTVTKPLDTQPAPEVSGEQQDHPAPEAVGEATPTA